MGLLKEICRKVTFLRYFIGATIIGIIILAATIFININYVTKITHEVEKNQINIENLLNNFSANKNFEETIQQKDKIDSSFMVQYYTVQANWLNIWLATLAIIMAVLGIMIPVCFVKFLENKEKEMNRIIEDAKKQKKETKVHVDEMEKKLKYVEEKSQKMSSELEKVKAYVSKAESEALYVEASTKFENDHDFDGTIELLLKAKELNNNENSEKISFLLGKCYCEKNYLNKAVTSFTECLNINPNNISALNLRSECNRRKQCYDEALVDTEKLIKLEPEKDIFKFKKMVILTSKDYEKNRYDALKFINSMKEKYAHSAGFLNVLGLIAIKIKEYEMSKDLLLKSIEEADKPYVQYYNLARAYIHIKDFKNTCLCIEKYLAVDDEEDNKGIFDIDKEEWLDIIGASQETEETQKIRNILNSVKITKRAGDDNCYK